MKGTNFDSQEELDISLIEPCEIKELPLNDSVDSFKLSEENRDEDLLSLS